LDVEVKFDVVVAILVHIFDLFSATSTSNLFSNGPICVICIWGFDSRFACGHGQAGQLGPKHLQMESAKRLQVDTTSSTSA